MYEGQLVTFQINYHISIIIKHETFIFLLEVYTMDVVRNVSQLIVVTHSVNKV